jgi:hypothetical protein
MSIPICPCGVRPCEKFGGEKKGYRKLCWKCRQYEPNPDLYREKHRAEMLDKKKIVIEAYGGKCACCQEKEFSFLSIDHIDNDGAEHRKKHSLKAGIKTYRFLINKNFPKGFQVLCFNCNFGKQINHGICPHQNRCIA